LQIEVCGVPFRAVRTRRPPLIRQPMGVKQLVVLAPYRHGVNDLYVEILPYFCCPPIGLGGKSRGRFTVPTRKRCPLF